MAAQDISTERGNDATGVRVDRGETWARALRGRRATLAGVTTPGTNGGDLDARSLTTCFVAKRALKKTRIFAFEHRMQLAFGACAVASLR